jgi:hypothetical protein
MCVMRLAYQRSHRANESGVSNEFGTLQAWATRLINWVEIGRAPIRYAGMWALAWLGDGGWVASPDRPRALRALLDRWKSEDSVESRRLAAWAFAAMPEVDRGKWPLGDGDDEKIKFVEKEIQFGSEFGREDRGPAALTMAYYLQLPWSTERFQTEARRFEHPWGTIIPRLASGQVAA